MFSPFQAILRTFWFVLKFFVLPQILFFLYLKPHAKFGNPTITPSESNPAEREEKNAVNSGYLVP